MNNKMSLTRPLIKPVLIQLNGFSRSRGFLHLRRRSRSRRRRGRSESPKKWKRFLRSRTVGRGREEPLKRLGPRWRKTAKGSTGFFSSEPSFASPPAVQKSGCPLRQLNIAAGEVEPSLLRLYFFYSRHSSNRPKLDSYLKLIHLPSTYNWWTLLQSLLIDKLELDIDFLRSQL